MNSLHVVVRTPTLAPGARSSPAVASFGQMTQVGEVPVYSPKIIFAQTPFNFSGCPRYVDKIIYPNFYKNKLPGSAR